MMRRATTLAALAGLAAAACTTEEDCSLAGACVNGQCVCDGWTHGAHCEQLNLLPADPARLGYRDLSMNSWGGSPVRHGDTWYLFYSQLQGGCPLDGYWSKHCEMWRAESDHPMGPWTNPTRILGSEAHNVRPYIAPDGTTVVYYVGQQNQQSVTCNGSALGGAYPTPMTAAGPVMILSSKSPGAPASEWAMHGPMTDSYEWHSATNPNVVFAKDGSVTMVVSRRYTIAPGRQHKYDFIMRADTWQGPYRNVTHNTTDAVDAGEDPDTFQTPRGYHMLNHNAGPAATRLVFSKDLKTWTVPSKSTNAAFNATLQWANGTVSTLCRRQRPRVIMAEDGMPGWLWTGVQSPEDGPGCPSGTRTWTSVQQIGRNFTN
eukprot:TRINITY_DN21281_c0_g1_i1.p1 TRINITY_DN21281_c0_g1~~TRINITY_DN21281_c0_g1_i1.p1  ORF type:complete len:374 (+),score=107.99 TRINITY_DN21281_c0_g1_i1:44-1165(+)